ncbi:SDR family NAD(P)-dependent oxidoreductase [Leifsonia sp. Root112D2]|uniref:SDR family NAD(P)-dependent oxidoreductase n=1 Tax=Leifsonia sp. Root112D2 TaxID=1736426 RepID=UPI0006F4D646|nr:SDR family NAD(P)-dependent oxidoreductase [Leifsonia sp. Root112D2]KQV05955.1 short-chain dehydrogenase [Leifsonia sp. Root112D2]
MSGARRTIVITGASSGIGAIAAARLADEGADVAVVGRNAERTRAVADRVNGTAFLADYDHLDDVHALAAALLARYERIDVLANNAGGIVPRRALTVDGNERIIQANHLAPFLLTNLLLPRLIESATATDAPVRVVSTASMANRFGHLRLDDLNWAKRAWLGGWRAYGTSKLATILFIRELAERMTGTGVSAYSVHPGIVATSFGMGIAAMRAANALTAGRYGISAAEGAAPLVALAASAPVGAPSGTYFDRLSANGRVVAQAHDAQLGRDLWRLSAQLVGLPAD